MTFWKRGKNCKMIAIFSLWLIFKLKSSSMDVTVKRSLSLSHPCIRTYHLTDSKEAPFAVRFNEPKTVPSTLLLFNFQQQPTTTTTAKHHPDDEQQKAWKKVLFFCSSRRGNFCVGGLFWQKNVSWKKWKLKMFPLKNYDGLFFSQIRGHGKHK